MRTFSQNMGLLFGTPKDAAAFLIRSDYFDDPPPSTSGNVQLHRDFADLLRYANKPYFFSGVRNCPGACP